MPTDPQKDNLLTYTDAGGVGGVLLEPMELASHPSPPGTCPVDTHSKDAFRNAPHTDYAPLRRTGDATITWWVYV